MTDTPGRDHNAPLAADRLRDLVERVERLNTERAELQADISAIYAQAKADGFDCRVLRRLIRMRARPVPEDEEMLLETYAAAMGTR